MDTYSPRVAKQALLWERNPSVHSFIHSLTRSFIQQRFPGDLLRGRPLVSCWDTEMNQIKSLLEGAGTHRRETDAQQRSVTAETVRLSIHPADMHRMCTVVQALFQVLGWRNEKTQQKFLSSWS